MHGKSVDDNFQTGGFLAETDDTWLVFNGSDNRRVPVATSMHQ
jgi:hypothetical protein